MAPTSWPVWFWPTGGLALPNGSLSSAFRRTNTSISAVAPPAEAPPPRPAAAIRHGPVDLRVAGMAWRGERCASPPRIHGAGRGGIPGGGRRAPPAARGGFGDLSERTRERDHLGHLPGGRTGPADSRGRARPGARAASRGAPDLARPAAVAG